eukprot:jgi/Tetstr1/449606/TSEL_036693.t1
METPRRSGGRRHEAPNTQAAPDTEFEYFASVFACDAAVKRATISTYLEGDGKKPLRTHFLRLTSNDIVRPVFDFDGKVPTAAEVPAVQADLEARVAAALRACYPGLPVNLLASPGTVPAHFDHRSNRGYPEVHKVSVHAYVAGARTDVATLKHAVCPRLAREFGLKPDTSIYSSARKLRMMGSAKTEADTRVLAPAAGSSDRLADYIAVAVDPAWPLHVVKPDPSAPVKPEARAPAGAGAGADAAPETAPPPTAGEAVAPAPVPAPAEDPLFARDVIAARADRRAEEREDWLRVGFALRKASAAPGAEDLFPLWDEFSARCPAKYDGAPALRRAWDAMDAAGRAGVTMGTLVAWARQDSPAAARAAEEARAARRRGCGRGRGRGEAGDGGCADAAEAVRLISQKMPDHFPPGAVDAAMTADGKSLRVTAGAHAAVVSPAYDVAIAGRFVGNLVDDAELDLGALSWVHSALPTAARVFRYGRPRAGETTLASVSAGADANLLLTENMVEVCVPGRRVVVTASKKRKDLYDSAVNVVNQYAAANMPAIHGALHGAAGIVNVNNGGVQNILVTQQAPEVEDDAGACRTFLKWLDDEGYRPVTCDGALFLYDPEEGVYANRTNHRGLRRLLAKARVGAYSTSSAKQDAMFKQLDELAPEDPGFIRRAAASGARKLAFANGVWDFAARELVPFSPEIVLFDKLPHRFPQSEEEVEAARALAAEINDRVVSVIWTRSAEYTVRFRCDVNVPYW